MSKSKRVWYLMPVALLGLVAVLVLSSSEPAAEATGGGGGWCWGAPECLEELEICLATCQGLPTLEFLACKGACNEEARICNMRACGAPI